MLLLQQVIQNGNPPVEHIPIQNLCLYYSIITMIKHRICFKAALRQLHSFCTKPSSYTKSPRMIGELLYGVSSDFGLIGTADVHGYLLLIKKREAFFLLHTERRHV